MMEFNTFDILYVKTKINTSVGSHVQCIESQRSGLKIIEQLNK